MQELLYIICCLTAVVLISGYNVVLMNSESEIEEPKEERTFSGMGEERNSVKF